MLFSFGGGAGGDTSLPLRFKTVRQSLAVYDLDAILVEPLDPSQLVECALPTGEPDIGGGQLKRA